MATKTSTAKTTTADKLKGINFKGNASDVADQVLDAVGVKKKSAKKSTKATTAQKAQAAKARKGAATSKAKKTVAKKKATTTTTAPSDLTIPTLSTASARDLQGIGGVSFNAADLVNGDFWIPNPAIPAIDEATYEAHKTQAEGQNRAIEVAKLNLKNINGVHQLEGQVYDIATTVKVNQTKAAKLEGAEIDYQAQLQVNGEKQEKLAQAVAKFQSAQRETGYTHQLIGLKDQNAQLDIQQAQNLFNQKAARFQAALAQ